MLALVHRRIARASIPFSILRIDKNFDCITYNSFLQKTGKKTCFDIHLSDFIIEKCS